MPIALCSALVTLQLFAAVPLPWATPVTNIELLKVDVMGGKKVINPVGQEPASTGCLHLPCALLPVSLRPGCLPAEA